MFPQSFFSYDMPEEKKGITRAERKAKKISRTIYQLRHQSEEELAAGRAKKEGLSYVDLNLMPVSGEVVRLIPEEKAKEHRLAAFFKTGRTLRVALYDPTDEAAKRFLQEISKENRWKIIPYVASLSSLEKAWRAYRESFVDNLDTMHLSLAGTKLDEAAKAVTNLRELVSGMEDVTTTQIMQIIFAAAVAMGSSDIHLEPQEKSLRIRYRIDGILHDVGELPIRLYRSVVNRIKVMGGMKLNIRDIAQDGRMTVQVNDEEKVDIRVNIIPSNFGEAIVMRLLIKSSKLVELADMGLRGRAEELVKKEISRPHGMIITTGPTGSGKTTTLYALLRQLNKPGTKIITIEDPIEYEIEGVSQTQVSKSGSYTFADGLRAIVRQDPDVIFVGEIRDDETADIAINASLTGHLVLTTIHANSAAATVPRLLELGVKPSLIAPAVNLFMAQRLVRRLCEKCKEPYQPAAQTMDMIRHLLAIISPKAKVEVPKEIKTLYRPKGCPACGGIGYKGRIGIFEVFSISEEINKIIEEMGSEEDIMRAAMEDGMMTMTQDGILKAVEGITSMEEVWRVTAQGEFLEDVYQRIMEQSLSRAIIVDREIIRQMQSFKDFSPSLAQKIKETNPKDILKVVLAGAILSDTGDIHIEPEADEVLVRYRIDGVLQEAGRFPSEEYPTILGNLKLLSGLKTEEHIGVADSRFSIIMDWPPSEENKSEKDKKDTTTEKSGKKDSSAKPEKDTSSRVDVRISFIVSGFGETVVMRLLNKSAVALDIHSLGLRPANLNRLLEAVKKPYGVILNTGPTGSGKTTTLYSLLAYLNRPDVKIITVEDPIEYQMDGILQTQVNEKNGYTFATALRALLRQNPDIMMIGEIRDDETASIAIQAALTGHLILSTLHTNSSAVSIHRLMNMGISTDDVATAVNAFMAQRLVRKLCPQCKKKSPVTAEEKAVIEPVLRGISDKAQVKIPPLGEIYRAVGCGDCHGGYKGRCVISEVLLIDGILQEMIASGELARNIVKTAVAEGMITMTQDGILKVLEGETDLAEIQRVTEL